MTTPPQYMTAQQVLNGQPAQQLQRPAQGLAFLVHANAKAGKSNFGDSGPQPRLILDIEGTATWTASRKIAWNPARQAPPQIDRHMTAGYGGTSFTPAWESAVVINKNPDEIEQVYRVLDSGRHPFNSASMDSVTWFQQRIIDQIAGDRKLERDHWGQLLRKVTWQTRRWADLRTHPVKPLWSITFIAGTHFDQRMNKWRPLIQGAGQDFLPYVADIFGYIEVQQDGSRWMITGPHQQYETGERVGGLLPYAMPVAWQQWPGWTAESMVKQVISGG